MEYVVIFEEDENGCSAYVPDLSGCIAAGDTIDEVRILIAEAIEFHIEGLREDREVGAFFNANRNSTQRRVLLWKRIES
ncbi:type II toxin-antitoxin system HicB family antitoxin [Candidatus Poribacteria bacterium]|nr:type II toxin-antitoxin system HicB family antitoxin [Candidatus Poribacteria bacterium]MYB00322.1 type II toxin-antitoxin system HicB family antitoxin [Candidatus Poribacteria bacterium]